MIVTVLLAAGSARRFGSQKLLARMPGGDTLVEQSVRLHRAAGTRVIAVVRPDCAFRSQLAQLGCDCVENVRADEGMGTSIAAGVAASREADAWLIALADMPFVQAETLRALVSAGEVRRDIVVPRFAGQAGHPVRFPHDLGPALESLDGDRGARSILQESMSRQLYLDTADAGILQDIDRPRDLLR